MKQRILLADNSYTIRRLVELSLQDLENVELFSIKDGANLKNKLLEIAPHIVLIDTKLQGFDGYQACKFVNSESALKNTKVLLMKGGFDPIDEGLLQGLNYEDIITKPFDSKLLESQIIKLLETVGEVTAPSHSTSEELDVSSSKKDSVEGEVSNIQDLDVEEFSDKLPEFDNDKEELNAIDKDNKVSFANVNEDIVKKEETPEFTTESVQLQLDEDSDDLLDKGKVSDGISFSDISEEINQKSEVSVSDVEPTHVPPPVSIPESDEQSNETETVEDEMNFSDISEEINQKSEVSVSDVEPTHVPPPVSIPESDEQSNETETVENEMDFPDISEEINQKSEVSVSDVEPTQGPPPVSIPEPPNEQLINEKLGNERETIETEMNFPDISEEINQKSEVPTFEAESTQVPPLVSEEEEMDFNSELAEIEKNAVLSKGNLMSDKDEKLSRFDEEIEPSEEITQGAYEEPSDSLESDSDDEELNPFKEDPPAVGTDENKLKEHIKEHEDDMGMESLTMEEMRIKSDIENRNKGLDSDGKLDDDTFGGFEKKPNFDNISFEDEKKESEFEEVEVKQDESEQMIDHSIFEAAEGILNDDIDMLHTKENSSDDDESDELLSPQKKVESISDSNIEENGLDEQNITESVEDMSNVENVVDALSEKESFPETPTPSVAQDFPSSIDTSIDTSVVKSAEEKIKNTVLPSEEHIMTQSTIQVDKNVPQSEVVESKKELVNEELGLDDKALDIPSDSVDMKEIIGNVESKLNVAVKDILWEIIPPIAEKIIKKEIEAIKKEIDSKEI